MIGRVFHELRFIEQWGSGIQRMTAACQEAGLQPPKLEELGARFRVTLSTARVRAASMDEPERKITALLRRSGAQSTASIARHAGLSARATLSRLKALTERGVLVEIGTGPHDPKRRYDLATHKR